MDREKIDGESDADFQWLASKAHLALGALFITTSWMLYPHPIAILIGFALCTAYAAIKEFWYDHCYEEEPERGSDAVDFVWHIVGAALAFVVWLSRYLL